MIYDLHVHTTDSDGKYSKYELIKKAENLKMEYICFTDHDFISNNNIKNDYENIYGKCNVDIISGIEFTVSDYNFMHILGYDLRSTKKLEEQLNIIKLQNEELCMRLLKKINNYYHFDLNLEEYSNYQLSKGLIRRMIVDKGYANSSLEAGNLYTGKNSLFYEKTNALLLKEIIELIKAANGIAILAHPSTLNLDNDSLEKMIKYLIDIGLDGIEVLNTSKTTDYQEKYYSYLAEKYKLLMSCGSDYHDERQIFGLNNNKSTKLIKAIKERDKYV